MSDRDLGPTPAQVARMRAKVADGIDRRQRARRRRAHVALTAAAAAVSLAVTAGTVVTSIPVELAGGSYFCFEADGQRATYHAISHVLDDESPTTTEAQVAASLEYCAIEFRRVGIEAPHPTVCRFFDQRLGTFPNVGGREPGDLCATIGLPLP